MNITAGLYKGRKLITPKSETTRPTLSKVRMAVFNVLQSMIDFEGKSFLDMYSGSGIMGLEAVSRGFEEVVFIDKNPDVTRTIKANCDLLKISPKIFKGDSLKVVPKLNKNFDVVYIDPPYFGGIYEKSLELVKTSAIIVVEHTVSIDFSVFKVEVQKKYGDKFLTFLKPLE